jgi:hypothetical protein
LSPGETEVPVNFELIFFLSPSFFVGYGDLCAAMCSHVYAK